MTKMLALLDKVRCTDMAMPVLIAMSAGTRRGECIGLKWGDVDVIGRRMMVRRSLRRSKGQGLVEKWPNGGKPRVVPMPEFAADVFANCPEKPDSWFVCGGEKPMSPERVSKWWRALLAVLDLPPMRFHDLRHSYSVAMLEAGVDMKTLSEMLGHRQMATTSEIYAHVSECMRERSVAALNQAVVEAGNQAETGT